MSIMTVAGPLQSLKDGIIPPYTGQVVYLDSGDDVAGYYPHNGSEWVKQSDAPPHVPPGP